MKTLFLDVGDEDGEVRFDVGTATIEDTRIDIQDAGSKLQGNATFLNFGNNFNLSKSGTGVDVDVSIPDQGIDVEDDGSIVVSGATNVNFSTNLSVADDGDGTVTVTGQSGGNPRQVGGHTPAISLADTEEIVLWRGTAPSGASLDVYSGSVSNSSGNAPSGLKIVLENVTDGTTTDLITSTYNTGSPISSNSVGGDDIKIKLVNSTGNTQTAQADLGARLE